MAPYKDKVEFEPKRKHGFIRVTGIWISGLIASFIIGAHFSGMSQNYFRYKCVAAIKSLSSNCPHQDISMNVVFGIAVMAAFICIRLWVTNGKS